MGVVGVVGHLQGGGHQRVAEAVLAFVPSGALLLWLGLLGGGGLEVLCGCKQRNLLLPQDPHLAAPLLL